MLNSKRIILIKSKLTTKKKRKSFLKTSFLDFFFLSFTYQKFINKVFLRGLKLKFEKIMYDLVYFMNVINIIKKPFFFYFFQLMERLSVNFVLLSKRRGRQRYLIPQPIKFTSRYKQGFKIIRESMLLALDQWSVRLKFKKYFFFIFLTYVVKKKNILIKKIFEFKNKLRKNRVFSHWRWI